MNPKVVGVLAGICLMGIIWPLLVGCGIPNPAANVEPLPNRLEVRSSPLVVGHQSCWVLRDRETNTEFILVTEYESTAICPIPQRIGVEK